MTRRSRRTAIIAGITVFLTLVGGGGAVAYWSAQAQLHATTGVAMTGLVQTAPTAPLTVTYSASTLKAAGPVTIQNTGSRSAGYALSLWSTSTTNAGLPGAISVAVAPVANTGACTAAASLSSPQTGTASSFTATGTVAAGASVVLCVQTSMASGDITTYGGASAGLRLRTALEYAPSDAWRVTGSAVGFTQSVVQAPFVPAGTVMTCNNGSQPWYIDLRFPENSPNQGTTTYRIFLAPESTPAARVSYPVGAMTGWNTMLTFNHQNDTSLTNYLNDPNGGFGNKWVFVEQSVSGGQWTAAAHGKIRLSQESGQPRIWCGWQ